MYIYIYIIYIYIYILKKKKKTSLEDIVTIKILKETTGAPGPGWRKLDFRCLGKWRAPSSSAQPLGELAGIEIESYGGYDEISTYHHLDSYRLAIRLDSYRLQIIFGFILSNRFI